MRTMAALKDDPVRGHHEVGNLYNTRGNFVRILGN